MALPWGINPIEKPEAGWQKGAPSQPKLWTKALVTTVIATFAFYMMYLFVPADMMQWDLFKEG